jgi:hypothetical protein
MHPDDSQLQVPPSFAALHTRAGRLTLRREELFARYDLCEDLANHLVDFAKSIHYDLGVAEDEVLARCRRERRRRRSCMKPAAPEHSA